ncbi:MAG: response regulator [Leptospirales bacterium]|nr:response regulator [Leptospirales bacterium]
MKVTETKQTKQETEEFSEILGTTDISRICGVTTQTVQSWIDRGVLRAFRTPGGHRRVKREDFIEFLHKFQFPAASRAPAVSRRILVADDDNQLRDSIKTVISRSYPEAKIVPCGTGPEALIQMGLSRPDLAILDIFMPGLSGVEIVEKIARTPEFKHTKVIIITGHKNKTPEARLREMGVAAVLYKPFSAADFKQALDSALRAISG